MHVKGVTSLGPHTCPACNLGHSRDLIKTNAVILFLIQCVFSMTSGDARGLGLLLNVGACAVGLCGNALIWLRGTWGVFGWSVPWGELRMSPHSTHCQILGVHVLFPMRSREHKWWFSNANESRDPQKQSSHCLSSVLIGYRLKGPSLPLCCSNGYIYHFLDYITLLRFVNANVIHHV